MEKFTDRNPIATRDIQLAKIVSSTQWNEINELLGMEEARHRLYSSIEGSCRKLGIDFKTKDRSWFMKAYNQDTEQIEYQKITLDRFKPYVLEIAEATGLRGYARDNIFIINVLQMIFNKQKRVLLTQ